MPQLLALLAAAPAEEETIEDKPRIRQRSAA
jgi:hypothetical protein